jgi:hypothetical protein
MAEYKTVPTFRPEINGPTIPTYTIMSGVELRNLYISRAYASQVVDWVNTGVDPTCVSSETLDALIEEWLAEAQILYSNEGDYRVRVLDSTGERVVIGSEVTFIIESEQVLIDLCDTPIPSCPDRIVVFQICNENAVTDDNFNIYLNNTYIGAVDLSAMAQVGSVFIASTDPNLVITSSDFACSLVGMVVYRFDPSLLQINNIIEMRNTQDNGSGNQGTVGIRNYLLTGANLSDPCVIADLEYSPTNGGNATLTFEYTECCP